MNTSMLKRVRRHFNSDMVPMHINRANRRAWIRSVRLLGDKWLYAKPLEKRSV